MRKNWRCEEDIEGDCEKVMDRELRPGQRIYYGREGGQGGMGGIG